MEEVNIETEAGISAEDRKDIMREIERVATENRITVTQEAFLVRAEKRGVLFPVVVMAAALAALLAGAAGFYFLFQRGETRIAREAVGTITAEGQLIQEVRREADTKIQEKNLAINQIQGRLTEIDKERQDLKSNMDAKVSLKERELREQMAAALEAERQKLQKQGLSSQAVSLRMQEMETRKSAEIQRRLDEYRKTAEAERRQAEANLQALRAEFTASLTKASAEREQAIGDAQKREQELRSQFMQRTEALESARAQAEQTVGALAAQRGKEELAASQLTGLYGVARADIARRDYEKALASLQAVLDFVNRPEVASLPALSRRHEFDVFVVDSLSELAREDRESARLETATLVEAANQITALRQLVAAADASLRTGKTADAEKAYGDALQLIPEVAAGYGYFVGRDRAAEAARQARLQQALDRAEAAFAAGSFPDAAAGYGDALVYLPVSPARLQQTLGNLMSAGAMAGSQELRQTQSRAAAAVLARADSLRAQAKGEEALPVYLDLLARYPLAVQAADAAQGIRATVQGMSEKAAAARESERASLGAQIAALQQELGARRAEVARLTETLTAERKGSLETLAAERKGGQDALAAERAQAQGARARAAEENAGILARIDTLEADLRSANLLATQGLSAVQRLRTLQVRFESLQRSYKDYADQELAVLTAKGELGLLKTKPGLDAFLGSRAMEETFPGLLDRIKRYDSAFQSSGRSDALQEAIGIVVDFSRQQTAEKRRLFFQDRLKSFQKDPDMQDFIQEMQRLAR